MHNFTCTSIDIVAEETVSSGVLKCFCYNAENKEKDGLMKAPIHLWPPSEAEKLRIGKVRHTVKGKIIKRCIFIVLHGGGGAGGG